MMDQTPAIVADGLTVRRGATTILDNLSCRIPQGGCTAILGRNGCGKTSFTRAATGELLITAGRIDVLGRTLGDCNLPALRQRIGVVAPTLDTAETHVSGAVVDASLTALEAVLTGFFSTVGLYARPDAQQLARARKLLEHVGLGHRCDLPVGRLSTGEQRRCLMARAMAKLPELLILDEPTAGLDVAGREQLLGLIQRMLEPAPGTTLAGYRPTIVLITHHVEELPPSTDMVLLMKAGRIVASGHPDEVISPESLSDTFGCKVFVRKVSGRFWLEALPEAWRGLS